MGIGGGFHFPMGGRILLAILFLGCCLGKYLIDKSIDHKEKW